MAVYSSLLAAGQTTGDGAVIIYTAPSLNTVIVRDVVLIQSGSGGTLVALYGVSGSVRGYIQQLMAPTRGVAYHWSGRQVLAPDEVLWLDDDSAAVYYRISGYVLGG